MSSYICTRCGFETTRKLNLKRHLFRKRICEPTNSDTSIKSIAESYGIEIPTTEKYDSSSNIGKLPLRKILKKFNIEELILKQKLGFSVNTENLWKNYGQEMAKKYLSDAKIIQDGWVKENWIKSNLNDKNIDIRHINKFFGLLAFEIWYRKFQKS